MSVNQVTAAIASSSSVSTTSPYGRAIARVRVRQVVAERRLAVGPGRHATQRHAAQLGPVPQEGGDGVAAPVLERLGRHREQGIVGEQRDHRVDVTVLDGVGEAADQLAFGGGVRPGRALAVGGRETLAERRAGALQGALGGGLAGVEQVGDLGGAEAEHVGEHQRRALARREVLERGDERQLDRLPGLVARRRAGGAVRDVVEQHVGVWLEPDRLGAARGLEASHPSPGPPSGGAIGRAARSGSGWSRSGRARSAPTRGPRTRRSSARRRGASPEPCPRRRAPSRGSGSSAAAAHAGGAR